MSHSHSRPPRGGRLRCIFRHAADGPAADAGMIAALERDFARQFGGGEAIAFDHGRTAMYAILRAMGVGAGHEVIVCAYTCHTVPRTIAALGARNVFVDIGPLDSSYVISNAQEGHSHSTVARLLDSPSRLCPDPAAIERAITPRTRAIILQHTYGWPADIDAVRAISARAGIPIIEDCCQTLGATHNGKCVGAFGVAAFHSFQWNKPISTGQGGMAVVHDQTLAQRVREFRNHHSVAAGRLSRIMLAAQLATYECVMFPRTASMLTTAFRALSKLLPMPGGTDSGQDAASRKSELERPLRMTSLQAVLARLEIARIAKTAAHRQSVAVAMSRGLRQADTTMSPGDADNGEASHSVPLRLPARVPNPLSVIAAARGHGFELTTWFDVPFDPLCGFAPEPDYVAGSCPAAERAIREIVLIPTGTRITQPVVRRMLRFFRLHHANLTTTAQ